MLVPASKGSDRADLINPAFVAKCLDFELVVWREKALLALIGGNHDQLTL